MRIIAFKKAIIMKLFNKIENEHPVLSKATYFY